MSSGRLPPDNYNAHWQRSAIGYAIKSMIMYFRFGFRLPKTAKIGNHLKQDTPTLTLSIENGSIKKKE